MCQPTLAGIISALVFCTCVTEGCVSYLSGALTEHLGWMTVCQCILLWLCLLVLYLFVNMPQMKGAHILEPPRSNADQIKSSLQDTEVWESAAHVSAVSLVAPLAAITVEYPAWLASFALVLLVSVFCTRFRLRCCYPCGSLCRNQRDRIPGPTDVTLELESPTPAVMGASVV